MMLHKTSGRRQGQRAHTAACREHTPSPAAQMSRTLSAESTDRSEGPCDGQRTLHGNAGSTRASADACRVGWVAVGVDIGGLAGQTEASAGARLRDDGPLRVAEQDRCSDRVEGRARGHLLHRVDGRRGAVMVSGRLSSATYLRISEQRELLARARGDAALDGVDDESGPAGRVLVDAGRIDDVDGLAVRHRSERGADHACDRQRCRAMWTHRESQPTALAARRFRGSRGSRRRRRTGPTGGARGRPARRARGREEGGAQR